MHIDYEKIARAISNNNEKYVTTPMGIYNNNPIWFAIDKYIPRTNYDNKTVKIYRDGLLNIPHADGLLNFFITLVSKLAYTKGFIKYNGYFNYVEKGEWVGGKGFFKTFKSNYSDTQINTYLTLLKNYNLIELEYDDISRVYYIKLSSQEMIDDLFPISDIDLNNNIVLTSTTDKSLKNVPAPTSKSGFIFISRNIINYIPNDYKFTFTDAFIDIITSLSFKDGCVYGSEYAPVFTPVISDSKFKNVCTFNELAQRWNWSKSKVSRFFSQYNKYFKLVNLGSNRGSVIFATEELFKLNILDSYYFTSRHTNPITNQLSNLFKSKTIQEQHYDSYNRLLQTIITNENYIYEKLNWIPKDTVFDNVVSAISSENILNPEDHLFFPVEMQSPCTLSELSKAYKIQSETGDIREFKSDKGKVLVKIKKVKENLYKAKLIEFIDIFIPEKGYKVKCRAGGINIYTYSILTAIDSIKKTFHFT